MGMSERSEQPPWRRPLPLGREVRSNGGGTRRVGDARALGAPRLHLLVTVSKEACDEKTSSPAELALSTLSTDSRRRSPAASKLTMGSGLREAAE